ncbi:hypothetical protein PG985_003465 [Apiospora marii]|uniref:uncharacterized protein n=1 Tax=Apiospora marii TaxID=335849 RepID=UPI00312EADBE
MGRIQGSWHSGLQLRHREVRVRQQEREMQRLEQRLRHQEQAPCQPNPERRQEPRSDVLDASSHTAKRLFSKGYKPPLNGDASLGHALRKPTSTISIRVKEGRRRTALHEAAARGFCGIISMLVTAGADLEERSEGGYTALLWAAYNGQVKSVQLLAELGANIECRNDRGRGFLHAAAEISSPELVSLIKSCRTCIDVDDCDDLQCIPTHMACYSGNFEALQALVSSGAKINLIDAQGFMPLHVAAARGHAVIVEYLLKRGADPAASNLNGLTPLHIAVENRSEAVVRSLLRNNIDANFKAGGEGIRKGRTPLLLAALFSSTAVFRILMEHGADPQLVGDMGESPLHLAAATGCNEIIQFLLEKKVSFALLDNYQATPLLVAARCRKRDAVRLLVSHGASLDVQDSDGRTPLYWAVHHDDKLFVRYLVKRMADLEARDRHGRTVLSLAAERGDKEIVSLLITSGANMTPKDKEGRTALHHAAQNGRKAVAEVLIDHGADTAAKNNHGLRPENLALKAGHKSTANLLTSRVAVSKKGLEQSRLQLVTTLVKAAANGNVSQLASLLDDSDLPISELNFDGRRALSAAAENGYSDMVEYLLEYGSQPNERDANGETALWWAARNGHVEVVETLLGFGASTEIGDLDDQTPLCAAAQKGHEVVAEALLKSGGNPNTCTTYGMTPLMFATIAGNFQMVELLLNTGAQVGYSDPRYGTSALSLANDGENENVKSLLDMHDTFESFLRMCNAIDQTSSVLQEEVGPGTDLSEALVDAAYFGLTAEIKRLLKAGVNGSGKPGKDIPLVSAAEGGHVEAVNILIASGANINCMDDQGKVALYWAAYSGNLEMIRLLIDRGADINQPDLNSRTVISHAAESGKEEAVRVLIDLGARKENTDRYFRTPLWYAVVKGHDKVVDLLLEKGSNVECPDLFGWTPLLKAAATGNWGLCNTLLRNGVQMRTETYGNQSPLSLAAMNGHESIVELLIDHGADLNHVICHGQTPLMLAVQNGHAMVVKILIEMGADTSIKDNYNRTPVSFAKELCQEAALSLLSQAGTLRSRNVRALRRMGHDKLTRRMQHRYAPLQKGFIRILELHPGRTEDVISFDLHIVDLLHDRSLSFDALSYEWKGKIGTIPVQCNHDRLLITPNCKAALRILRDEKKPRMLWVDAICIDQENKKECSSQVAMMNKIFRTAKAVLMWLGKEEKNSEVAFNSIPILANAYEQADHTSFKASIASFRSGTVLDAVDTIPRREEVMNGWTSLARRTYFQRVWIFQEVILAGSKGLVMCGSLSSSWDSFKAALQGYIAWQHQWVHPTDLLIMNDDTFRDDGKLDFAQALAAMATFECSDARDKVFATLGLVKQDYIVADYTITLQEVIVKANILIINTYDWLWHWGHSVPKSPTGLQDLPSWAVDITEKVQTIPAPWARPVDFKDFITGQKSASSTVFQVPGCILDSIVFTTHITKEKETFDIAKPVVQAMSRLHRGVYDLYPSTGKSNEDKTPDRQETTNGQALLATILNWDGQPPRQEDYFGSFLASKISRDGDIPDDDMSKHPPSYLQNRVAAWNARSLESKTYDLEVCRSMERLHRYGCHLVYTGKDYLGISEGTSVGEDLLVALVAGAGNLAMLRKRTDDVDEWYERCGQVWLYGWDVERIKSLEDIGENAEVTGPAQRERCGTALTTQLERDITSPIEDAMKKADEDYSCNAYLCRGYQLEDNLENVQPVKAGDVIDFHIDLIAGHHPGYAGRRAEGSNLTEATIEQSIQDRGGYFSIQFDLDYPHGTFLLRISDTCHTSEATFVVLSPYAQILIVFIFLHTADISSAGEAFLSIQQNKHHHY